MAQSSFYHVRLEWVIRILWVVAAGWGVCLYDCERWTSFFGQKTAFPYLFSGTSVRSFRTLLRLA